MNSKQVGLTKDVGFQVGVRRTFNLTPEEAWEKLLSKKGKSIWLGKLISGDVSSDFGFRTKDGIEGKKRVFKPFSHFRIDYKKTEWTNQSMLQVRVIKMKDKTKATIRFHQEKLLDSNQREEMKKHWEAVLAKVAEIK